MGYMKADVTEDIPVQSGVSSYYSSLVKWISMTVTMADNLQPV